MNARLARAGSIFLAPAAPATTTQAAAEVPADFAGVLAAPADLLAVAGAVAGDLRRRSGAKTAVVCAPGGAGPASAARPAAGALARRLAARDIAAVAAGTLCRVALPDDPEAAVREAWRVTAAAAGTPVVLALSSRCDVLDTLLAQADRLVLAPRRGEDPAYTGLAGASLARLGPPADLVHPPVGFLARRLAAAGLPVARPLAVPDAVPA